MNIQDVPRQFCNTEKITLGDELRDIIDYNRTNVLPVRVFNKVQVQPVGESSSVTEEAEPLFGTHLREAVRIAKDWVKNP